MKKMVESLSKKGNDIWNIIEEQMNEFAKEEGLSKEQLTDLKKRKLLATKYQDLQEENEYLAKTSDILAKRAIRRNKLEMAKLNDEYQQLYPKVKEVEKKFDKRMLEIAKDKKNTNNKK